jgi:2-methylisocitrate lyase-like PEP mutase family enzyme
MPQNHADSFTALHDAESPLILYNVWDAATARAAVDAGAQAVATGSWSLAAAHGYEDGQNIPFDLVKTIVARIVASVDVPVSVDFECGYGDRTDRIATNFTALLDLGVAGINVEDQDMRTGGLVAVATQSARIGALRAAADAAGIRAFINARTDLFLQEADADRHAALVPQAIERAQAYTEAGASGFFVPGLTDMDAVRSIGGSIGVPLNVMVSPETADPAALRKAGVSRISYGPHSFFAAMEAFGASAKAALSERA